MIIYGTGFKTVEAMTELNVAGRDGVKLRDAWRDGAEAYHGIAVAGFPNLFLLLGPNTGLGHNSVVFMIESQVQHVLACLRLLARQNAETIEVRAAAVRRFNAGIQRRLRHAVWSEGGCTSWYLDAGGVNRALWPGFSFEYWARTGGCAGPTTCSADRPGPACPVTRFRRQAATAGCPPRPGPGTH